MGKATKEWTVSGLGLVAGQLWRRGHRGRNSWAITEEEFQAPGRDIWDVVVLA